MITKKYLIYFAPLSTGIRWPVSWRFPTDTELLLLCTAAGLIAATLIVVAIARIRKNHLRDILDAIDQTVDQLEA